MTDWWHHPQGESGGMLLSPQPHSQAPGPEREPGTHCLYICQNSLQSKEFGFIHKIQCKLLCIYNSHIPDPFTLTTVCYAYILLSAFAVSRTTFDIQYHIFQSLEATERWDLNSKEKDKPSSSVVRWDSPSKMQNSEHLSCLFCPEVQIASIALFWHVFIDSVLVVRTTLCHLHNLSMWMLEYILNNLRQSFTNILTHVQTVWTRLSFLLQKGAWGWG